MSDPEQIPAIVEQIKPLLAGKAAPIQGAVLADLLATWLAGHLVVGDVEETRKVRADLLATHCRLVRQLTEINARIMGTV